MMLQIDHAIEHGGDRPVAYIELGVWSVPIDSWHMMDWLQESLVVIEATQIFFDYQTTVERCELQLGPRPHFP
jgi:hypothetical protein